MAKTQKQLDAENALYSLQYDVKILLTGKKDFTRHIEYRAAQRLGEIGRGIIYLIPLRFLSDIMFICVEHGVPTLIAHQHYVDSSGNANSYTALDCTKDFELLKQFSDFIEAFDLVAFKNS